MPHGAWEEKLRPQRSTPDGWGRLLPAEPISLLRIIPVAMTDTDADKFRKKAELQAGREVGHPAG